MDEYPNGKVTYDLETMLNQYLETTEEDITPADIIHFILSLVVRLRLGVPAEILHGAMHWVLMTAEILIEDGHPLLDAQTGEPVVFVPGELRLQGITEEDFEVPDTVPEDLIP